MNLGVILAVIAGWYLTGLSVTVGFVVYPSFALVDEQRWVAFHQHHSQRISWAVGLPWLVQAVGLSIWLITDPGSTWVASIVCALGALGAVILTVAAAVPSHNRLSQGFDQREAKRLLSIHWVRTIVWVVTAGAATAGLIQVF